MACLKNITVILNGGQEALRPDWNEEPSPRDSAWAKVGAILTVKWAEAERSIGRMIQPTPAARGPMGEAPNFEGCLHTAFPHPLTAAQTAAADRMLAGE